MKEERRWRWSTLSPEGSKKVKVQHSVPWRKQEGERAAVLPLKEARRWEGSSPAPEGSKKVRGQQSCPWRKQEGERAAVLPLKRKRMKKKMFIQIKNIWYYNVYIHKLKLSIKYFNLNITVTSHAEKVCIFTRQISDTRLSLLY